MNNTIQEFKNQRHILEKISDFLIQGEKFGIKISSDDLDKIERSKVMDVKLKMALIGGFSEGKTSIAAAWLGKIDPKSMLISHEESSNEIKMYDIDNDLCLVDTPGLFGFKEKHSGSDAKRYKDITKQYVSEAHLVLYVMNPHNPIKDSHQEDLQWLFRELQLLSRTVFVLSKFDEVVDIENQETYQEMLKIKQESIIKRLSEVLNLSNQEKSQLSIVAVSANPFDEGVEYWLKNKEEFENLSYIGNLQKATLETIKRNDGFVNITKETLKSIARDVLGKQLPDAEGELKKLEEAVKEIEENANEYSQEIQKVKRKISDIRIDLRDFARTYFSDLILQLQNTGIENFNEFFEREIGKEGININIKIKNEIERYVNAVVENFLNIEINFKKEEKSLIEMAESFGFKDFVTTAAKNQPITNTMVITTRDVIVDVGNKIGIKLAEILKFKPYGAMKLAKGINSLFAFAGLAFEVWNTWDKMKKQEEFEKAKDKLQEAFEKQRESMIEFIESDSFEYSYFPCKQLLQQFSSVERYKESLKETQQLFQQWMQQGKEIQALIEQ